MKKGILIVIEGGDGSGKTTQQKLISEYLKKKGLQVVLTRKPGGTIISEKIRELLLDPSKKEMNNKTEFLLYEAAEAQLSSEVIIPALENNKIVLCDRLYHSTYVYQGFGRGIDINLIKEISKFITNLVPDLVIILDIDPEEGLKRTVKKDRITEEGINFHKRVREGYLKLKELLPQEKIIIIDASQPKEKVFEDIRKEVDKILS